MSEFRSAFKAEIDGWKASADRGDVNVLLERLVDAARVVRARQPAPDWARVLVALAGDSYGLTLDELAGRADLHPPVALLALGLLEGWGLAVRRPWRGEVRWRATLTGVQTSQESGALHA